MVVRLENDLKQELEKVETKEDKRSLFKKVEGARQFLQRAEKRYSTIQEGIIAVNLKEKDLRNEIEESRAKLKSMELELSQDCAPPLRMNMSTLEEQVRELLVGLHSSRAVLPTGIMDGVEAIKKSLPQGECSDDIGDSGGAMVVESMVVAARLDEALIDSPGGGAPEAWKGTGEELQRATTDEDRCQKTPSSRCSVLLNWCGAGLFPVDFSPVWYPLVFKMCAEHFYGGGPLFVFVGTILSCRWCDFSYVWVRFSRRYFR